MTNAETVSVLDIEHYTRGTAYFSFDGLSGFFITENGDVESVFNNSGKPGFLYTIAPIAKSDGKTLDCFTTKKKTKNLPKLYSDKR